MTDSTPTLHGIGAITGTYEFHKASRDMSDKLRELGLQLGDAHAEIRELKAKVMEYGKYVVGRLKEIDGLKADAERYRWLRDINAFRLNDFGVWCFYAGMNLRGQNLDDAIDAAIKETP